MIQDLLAGPIRFGQHPGQFPQQSLVDNYRDRQDLSLMHAWFYSRESLAASLPRGEDTSSF